MYLFSTIPRYQVPLLRNDYFPWVLLFLQQNELAWRQETFNGSFSERETKTFWSGKALHKTTLMTYPAHLVNK